LAARLVAYIYKNMSRGDLDGHFLFFFACRPLLYASLISDSFEKSRRILPVAARFARKTAHKVPRIPSA
jgi:hypothetical protein